MKPVGPNRTGPLPDRYRVLGAQYPMRALHVLRASRVNLSLTASQQRSNA